MYIKVLQAEKFITFVLFMPGVRVPGKVLGTAFLE